MQTKIIFFELNEVPYFILDDYIKRHPHGAFSQLLKKSRQFITISPDVEHLSPWVTWPTVHRGVSSKQHGLLDINQDTNALDKNYPPIWKILATRGKSVGVFGSFHTGAIPKNCQNYAFYIPDAFANHDETFPENIKPFQTFNLEMARASARNVSTAVPKTLLVNLLKALPNLGFRTKTYIKVAKQIIDERIRSYRKCRRRTFQSVLSFDVYLNLLKKYKPDFSTFFTNHVASSMHRFWSARYPEHYANYNLPLDEKIKYCDEIDFAMREAENMLRDLMHFCEKNSGYQLWLLSSMGQAAVENHLVDSQLNMRDPDQFMRAHGVPSDAWQKKPAMFPQFNFEVDEKYIDSFKQSLSKFSINQNPLLFRQDKNFFAVDLGQDNLHLTEIDIRYDSKKVSLKDFGLENLAIDEKAGTSAYHIPEGCLIIYDPKKIAATQTRETIPAESILAMALQAF